MDKNYIKFDNDNEDNLGELVRVGKSKSFKERSKITGRGLYETCYVAYFFNPEERSTGMIWGKKFNKRLVTKTKSMMIKVLREKGFDNIVFEDIYITNDKRYTHS